MVCKMQECIVYHNITWWYEFNILFYKLFVFWKNIEKAIKFYEKAIELGCVDSLDKISEFYMNGDYDHDKYVKLYTRVQNDQRYKHILKNIKKPKKKIKWNIWIDWRWLFNMQTIVKKYDQ